MSSHMFDEVEDTCDKVALIKNGKIVSVVATNDIKHNKNKTFRLEFVTAEDFHKFLTEKIGKINGNLYIMLNIGVFLFLFATSGISFLASCAANLSKYSLTFGAGIPIAFFLFKTVAQTSDSLEVFKYFTLNTLYDASAIAGGTVDLLPLVALLVIGIVLYFLSVQVFKRKDLPL